MDTYEFQLNEEDLPLMVEIAKTILVSNIAIKNFQMIHSPNHKLRKMMSHSINNSKDGLKRIDEIENPESINTIIEREVGEKNWVTFIEVLTAFSGVLSDDKFYKFDKDITIAKGKGA